MTSALPSGSNLELTNLGWSYRPRVTARVYFNNSAFCVGGASITGGGQPLTPCAPASLKGANDNISDPLQPDYSLRKSPRCNEGLVVFASEESASSRFETSNEGEFLCGTKYSANGTTRFD